MKNTRVLLLSRGTRDGVNIEDFLVKPKNKDHVSCLSSRVSRFLSVFFQFQNLHREEARNFPMSLRLPIWMESSELTFSMFFLSPYTPPPNSYFATTTP